MIHTLQQKGRKMDLENYSQEIQNYIVGAESRRRQKGRLDYDTCQSILEYAAETNSDTLFGVGYYFFAEYYWWHEDYERTMHCLMESTKCLLSVKMYDYLARAYNMMGAVSETKGNRLVALSYFNTGLQYAEYSGDLYAQAMAQNNIGYILVRMKRYKEAAEHYNCAIDFYIAAECTVYTKKNIVRCMIECGLCYLVLGQDQEALGLWERIQEILQENSSETYLPLCLLAFESACDFTRGHRKRAKGLMDELEQKLIDGENPDELEDIVAIIAELLERTKSYKNLDRLIQIIERYGMKEKAAVYLDMYPYRRQYLLSRKMVKEYIFDTKRYLKLYSQHGEESKTVTAQILELQDELQRMELEQRDMQACNQKLEEIAFYDSLTSLANRTWLNEYLSQKFEEAYNNHTPFGVELMDIDRFKEYNDTYGHLAGDVCIETVAGVLKKVQNDNVFCARYGGDEFMIVYSNMTVTEIRNVAEEIQSGIRALTIPHEATGCDTSVTVSQGIFIRTPEQDNREWDFNSMADVVLYQAKREGRNCYRISTEFS